MKRFDGHYGKLVEDWGQEEWTRFYHDHFETPYFESTLLYLGSNITEEFVLPESETAAIVERLFCGPYFTADEVAEAADMYFIDFIDKYEAPLSRYFAVDTQFVKEGDALRFHTATPVQRKLFDDVQAVQDLKIEQYLNEPIGEAFEGSVYTEEAARRSIGFAIRGETKCYCGGRIHDALMGREYAYIVAKYPNLRDKYGDHWAAHPAFARFHPQYVDYFANLNDVERARLDKCKRIYDLDRLGSMLESRDRWRTPPSNINECDTLDGCWLENSNAG